MDKAFKDFRNLHKNVKSEIVHLKENHIVKDGYMYSLDGEYIGNKFDMTINPKMSQKQYEQYRSKHDMYKFEKDNGGFISLFYHISNNEDLLQHLTKPEITRLLYLSTYISFNTNKIVYDNGRDIPDNDLMKLLKYKPRQYKEYMDKLTDNNLLYIDKDNNKYITEQLCKFGTINIKQLQKENKNYIRLFRDTVREVFEKASVRELGKLSIIYSILPYINLEYNVVCYNPNEKDIEKVEFMPLQVLSDKLGYSNSTKFRQSLYSFKIKGEYIFGFFMNGNDRRNMKMLINPRLFYAGGNEYLKVLLFLFDLNNKDSNMIVD